MNGLTDTTPPVELGKTILTWFTAGLLLFGPLFLVPGVWKSTRAGLVPFLLSPVIVVVFVPYLSGSGRWMTSIVLLRTLLFPGFLGLLFFLSSGLLGSPLPDACLKGSLFICCFSMFLAGLTIVLQEMGGTPFVAQWGATMVGLLLVGSFVYLSPVADHFYNDPSSRNTVIELATRINPLLVMAGGILEQDLLRGAFLYEHLPIGRYYSYSAPSWSWVSMIYFLTGVVAGGAGLVVYRRRRSRP